MVRVLDLALTRRRNRAMAIMIMSHRAADEETRVTMAATSAVRSGTSCSTERSMAASSSRPRPIAAPCAPMDHGTRRCRAHVGAFAAMGRREAIGELVREPKPLRARGAQRARARANTTARPNTARRQRLSMALRVPSPRAQRGGPRAGARVAMARWPRSVARARGWRGPVPARAARAGTRGGIRRARPPRARCTPQAPRLPR